ncbi:putative DNA-binding protein (MmcQ/YjbR family) [Streptomyces sp. TLI_235]|nr:MmcQ/YjbR family DNA-binding protein [Streptomyces sp. TLI_235]PBC71615.1 putative DNA-binding protein (MmcQ/YjbR family) [Streptomyces sp. TLI_235]
MADQAAAVGSAGPGEGARRAPVERLRAVCLALPGAEERPSHGEAAWFAGRPMFATTADRHHDERTAFWAAAAAGVQEHLVAAAPERFFRPPYVGGRGWIGVYLDVAVDWRQVEDLVLDAFLLVAPARLRAAASGGRPVRPPDTGPTG